LHDPACDGRCGPSCIGDVESFAYATVTRHYRQGVRRNGSVPGDCVRLSDDELEEAVAFAIATVWETSLRFNGNGRMSGFVLQRLHFRLIDRERARRGAGTSTRDGAPPISIESYVPGLHDRLRERPIFVRG
jgi:hypothetical protein